MSNKSCSSHCLESNQNGLRILVWVTLAMGPPISEVHLCILRSFHRGVKAVKLGLFPRNAPPATLSSWKPVSTSHQL